MVGAVLIVIVLQLRLNKSWPPDVVEQGIEPNPGPGMTLLSLNTRSLKKHWRRIVGSDCDVVAIQEVYATNGQLPPLRAAIRNGSSYRLTPGLGVNGAGRNKDRAGVALLVKQPADAQSDDPICKWLFDTTRWHEVMVPIADGTEHMYCAFAHGYSGASAGGAIYIRSERFPAIQKYTEILPKTLMFVSL